MFPVTLGGAYIVHSGTDIKWSLEVPLHILMSGLGLKKKQNYEASVVKLNS